MSIVYRTSDDGTVETEQPDGTWATPWPSAAEIALFEKQTVQWLPLVESAAATYGLPQALVPGILAIVYAESGGRADIGPSFDGGVGLMAITAPSLKAGHTDQELKDPALNIDIGVGKMIAKEYAIMGLDIPQIASGYNGGFGPSGAHHSSSAPWGWVEYKIPSTGAYPYISKVVRMNNYGVQAIGGAAVPASGDTSSPSGGRTLLVFAAAIAAFALVRAVRS